MVVFYVVYFPEAKPLYISYSPLIPLGKLGIQSNRGCTGIARKMITIIECQSVV
ncbi:MAG: hypothetical protein LBC20_04875 [Planctomycetaceae bacterium]|nr:hypothetical protein [Planctomycetaceae bacterium]